MKRMMYNTMVIVMLIMVIGGVTIARLVNNNYIKEGVVVATHASNEEVIVVDTTGNEWCFYGVGYEEGDTVLMTVDAHNTDNIITDDIIKHVEIIYK